MSLSLLGAAVVPSLLIFWYFHARDANPEPRSVLWQTFKYGAYTTVAAALLEIAEEYLVGGKAMAPLASSINGAFFSAALIEESFKFLVLVRFCSRHPAFDESMDGIIYGVTASLGFATLENILYVAQGGMDVAVLRALLAVPGHASWGALMGYFVGQARFGPDSERARNLTLALVVPIALHGGYDFPLMFAKAAGEAAPGALLLVPPAIVIGGWIACVRLVGRLNRMQLATLPPINPASPVQMADAGPAFNAGHQQRHQAQGRSLRRWLQLLSGGLLSSWGGLVCLGVTAAIAADPKMLHDQLVELALGLVIIGGAPLALGLWLFWLGLQPRAMQREVAA
ncbi:MAG: PrsW family intramembrane metalloprotease [Myxococcales bacterium]|nr:PrsW family intramembrane metalloprotease [Myxococcales bacterium]